MTRKTRADYEVEIRELHKLVTDHPDSETLYKKLNQRLGKWQKLLEIIVQAAGNEKKPWTTQELGLECARMPLKSDTGYNQVGDYFFNILPENQSSAKIIGGLLVERKEVSDLYSTLMNLSNRARFGREIERYRHDNRFNQLVVMVEGTYEGFLKYSHLVRGKESYKFRFQGASVESRRATVAAFYIQGIPIIWCGTRTQAVKLYPQLIRQWCIKNYDKVIKLK